MKIELFYRIPLDDRYEYSLVVIIEVVKNIVDLS